MEIAERRAGWEETMLELRDVIGAGLMAAELGCGEEFCAEIVRAGMVHDILRQKE